MPKASLHLTSLILILILTPARAQAEEARRLGPFELTAGDATLRPGFAAQLLGTARADEPFSLVERRLRLKLDADAAGDRLALKVQINAAPGSLELIDLWARWSFDDAISLRVGQFTIPLTRYRSGSFSTRLLMDWAPTTRFFGGERQRGIEVAGARGGFDYALGLFEGSNARASHATGAALLHGLTPENASRLVDPDARPAPHPEVVARIGWSSSEMDLTGWADREGGRARAHIALSGGWDSAPVTRREWQGRAAAEVMLKAHGLGLGAVGYASTTRASSGEHVLGALGVLAGASYHLPTGTTLSARAAVITIGERARADATRALDLVPLSGEREWGLGVRQDLWGADLQVGADAILDEDIAGADTQRSLIGRVLVQLTL